MPMRSLRLLAALVLAGSACTGGSSDTTVPGAVPGDPTTTTAPASSTSSTAAAERTSDLVLDMTRVDDPSFDGGVLNAVVAAGPGLVAVGTDEVPEDAAVWVSEDGTVWERIESDSFAGVADDNGLEGAQFMNDVGVGADVIVAVGGYERRDARDLDPGVWLSPDGRTWERIDDEDFAVTGDGRLVSVVTWNGGFVAVGESPGPVGSGERRPGVWTSDDGRDWAPADGLALRIDGTITAITRRGSRLVAVGATGHVLRPAVWFSDDGQTWDVVTSADVADSIVGSVDIGDTGELVDMGMTAVAVTPDGFVAAGATGDPSQTVFWESSDGLEWRLTGILSDVERATIPVVAEGVATMREGVVAVGTGQLDTTRFPPISYAEVWVSLDGGDSWGQLPRLGTSTAVAGPQSPWHIGAMHDVIAFDGGVLAVGFVPYQDVTLPGPFYHQAVWLGTWR